MCEVGGTAVQLRNKKDVWLANQTFHLIVISSRTNDWSLYKSERTKDLIRIIYPIGYICHWSPGQQFSLDI